MIGASARLDSPSFHRNVGPIRAVLERWLGESSGDVVEIGSGTGQHCVAFAEAMRGLRWWPTDPSDDHLRSIAAWREAARLPNLAAPMALDATATDWRFGRTGRPPNRDLAAIVAINVLHIAPWAVTEGIMQGAGRYLGTGGLLFIYGPFKRDGEHTAPSNAAFDRSLRLSDPSWGVRDVADVEGYALTVGLNLADMVAMPANNLMLVFRRR
ncbi:DUF938 domain-containing protein [Bauldia sp.]|uniref:DUF938 domain-containing protein n=1 Tax=Bauldia sp. TaxID=2575872 RepID=UPI003BAA0203